MDELVDGEVLGVELDEPEVEDVAVVEDDALAGSEDVVVERLSLR